MKNKFLVGDTLEIMTPQGNQTFKLSAMQDHKGQSIHDAKGSGHKVWIQVETPHALAFALLVRYLPSVGIKDVS